MKGETIGVVVRDMNGLVFEELKQALAEGRVVIMIKKQVCDCGNLIDKARQALDLENCEACAKEMKGNILQNVKVINIENSPDLGNAPAPAHPDNRLGRCLKCGTVFHLGENHVCPPRRHED